MFLQSDYNDLMPSEPETGESPVEKTGPARFLEIMGNNCVALLQTNLLFLLGCIPVVTIPISLYAMNRTIRRMVLDKPVKCTQSFLEVLRQDWKRAYLAFLLTALPLGFAGCGAWFYLRCAASNPLFFLPFLVCSTIFLIALLSSGCLYALLDSGRSVKEAVRLAVLLGVVKPLRTVPAALCSCGLPVVAILFFPLSGAYLLLIGFSLPCLLGHFYLRTMLKQYMGIKKSEEAGQPE